ncbi:MAG: hypothetical protein ABIT07_11875 [Ferruginibacter sp.]
MDDHKINNKIEEVLGSLNGLKRAMPKPFLMTRINARLQQETGYSFWTAAVAFISGPLVAGFAVVLFLILNVVIISQNDDTASSNTAVQNTNTTQYEFAINVASIYDIENQ